MQGLLIRLARTSDLPAINEIYNREVLSGTSTFDTEPRDADAAARWFEEHDAARHPVIVAVESGTVVAWASLSPWSRRGAYSRTVEGSLFVAADRRGTGLGRSLTRELVARAAAAGHHVVLARVEASNQASLALLVGEGFTEVGTMHEVGHKFDADLDVVLFELVLAEPETAAEAGSAEDG